MQEQRNSEIEKGFFLNAAYEVLDAVFMPAKCSLVASSWISKYFLDFCDTSAGLINCEMALNNAHPEQGFAKS